MIPKESLNQISSKQLKDKIEKGKGYIKRIAFIGLLIYFVYGLLATLNILPRYDTMYRNRRGGLNISFFADPLKNFEGWIIVSLVILAVTGFLYYWFSKKKRSANDYYSSFIFDIGSYIFFYASIFKAADFVILLLLKLFGVF